ncbi:SDR family oxidoreductase [Phenylobacterium terrae]|uniref:SDR family oxidoreductase n=1 Tax=Phenylobacterium terrae TaxID=2665495 RepID=A0ABW4MVP9_9CAUL
MGLLENKVVIITGASSGIGLAAAQLFAREGARLVLNARRKEPLARAAAEIDATGRAVAVVAGDVGEADTARALVDTAVERFGGLDAALNNAGDVGVPGPLAEVDEATWRKVLDVNLTAAFLGARRQIPAMLARGGGSIIFTSSFVGHAAAFPGLGPYAAAKAGLVGLARAIAVEYGPEGVRANALLSGGVDTPMGRSVAGTPEAQALVRSLHAVKRQAEPEEIAQAALFLASDRSSFVTGSAMYADGGASICKV